MIIGTKKFNTIDNIYFAEFSGDFNPIHLDSEFASRTPYESPIVHGTQVLLWSLEKLVTRVNKPIGNFKVIFNKPVQFEQDIWINWNSKTSSILVKDKKLQTLINIIDISFQENISKEAKDQHYSIAKNKLVPEEPNISSLVVNTLIKYEFNGNSEVCTQLYPELTRLNGVSTLCEIANLSAFIGMKVPGKHSLLRSAHIQIRREYDPNGLFKLTSIDSRVGAVSFLYTGQYIKALIKGFFTPKPIKIPKCAEIKLRVNPESKLKNANVLVIGGSRGIGAWATKIFAIYGCNVTATYNSNLSLALEIKNDIIAFGGECSIIKFNVLMDSFSFLSNNKFEYILYFATPAITANHTGKFDNGLYKKYKNYYVESFESLVRKLNPNCITYYPSTTLIDIPELGFKEYIKAKKQGEKFSRDYRIGKFGKIVSTRLPRLLTDQNNWIFSKSTTSPEAEVEKIIKILIQQK